MLLRKVDIIPLYDESTLTPDQKITIIKKLIAHKFDVNRKDQQNFNFLQHFIYSGLGDDENFIKKLSTIPELDWNKENAYILYRMFQEKLITCITYLLQNNAFNERSKKEVTPDCFLPIIVSEEISDEKKVTFMKTLNAHGVNINCTDENGNTLLHYLSSKQTLNDLGDVEFDWDNFNKYIISLISLQNFNWNTQNNQGNTPLHMAVLNNNIELIEQLTTIKTIKKNIKNVNGKTPSDLADKEELGDAYHTIIKLLEEPEGNKTNLTPIIDLLQTLKTRLSTLLKQLTNL